MKPRPAIDISNGSEEITLRTPGLTPAKEARKRAIKKVRRLVHIHFFSIAEMRGRVKNDKRIPMPRNPSKDCSKQGASTLIVFQELLFQKTSLSTVVMPVVTHLMVKNPYPQVVQELYPRISERIFRASPILRRKDSNAIPLFLGVQLL